MICGFLHRKEQKIVNGRDEEIILRGWGLGNWLLAEGYMWQCTSPRFDRQRRIEQVIEQLTGKEFAHWFWKSFQENYIRREDIQAMSRLGYNSVRIPFHYKVFMEDGPGLHWKEEGFALLDRCLDWCEEEGLYAFLDLHGAPGGQTGSNIDDSVDNVPRLFIDTECRTAAIELWKKLARRYAGREVVGGYDLLNEPIVPANAGKGDFDLLIPELKQFYREAVREIRRVDKNHLLSIEGPHWATDVSIFDELYDENMVLHFHRYAEPPEIACLKPYMKAGRKLRVPLWMGETGENTNAWYAALYPLAESLGIGYNLWPWKKMDCTNSPCSLKRPKGWEEILSYIEGGPHPGYARSAGIFCEYLENMKYENCIYNEAVTHHVLRRPPFSLQAVDFDYVPPELDFDCALPEPGFDCAPSEPDFDCAPPDRSFDSVNQALDFNQTAEPGNGSGAVSSYGNRADYRCRSGMEVIEQYQKQERRFAFDCGWERFALVLHAGNAVAYSFDTTGLPSETVKLTAAYEAKKQARLAAGCDTEALGEICLEAGKGSCDLTFSVHPDSGKCRFYLHVLEGSILLKTIDWNIC